MEINATEKDFVFSVTHLENSFFLKETFNDSLIKGRTLYTLMQSCKQDPVDILQFLRIICCPVVAR